MFRYVTLAWWLSRPAVLASAVVAAFRFPVLANDGTGFKTLSLTEMLKLFRNAPGSIAFPWTWDSGTAANPGAGKVRFNHATLASVTGLEISETAAGSLAASGLLDLLTAGSLLKVTPASGDGTTFLLAKVGATTDNGTHRSIVLTHVASNGTFVDEETVLVAANAPTIPAISGSGTKKLQSIDGVLTWTTDS